MTATLVVRVASASAGCPSERLRGARGRTKEQVTNGAKSLAAGARRRPFRALVGMPDHRCLTCLFWLPAYPEDDLRAAERAVETRRGFGAALAGACMAPGRGRHVSSRHACDRWTSPKHANPHVPHAPAPPVVPSLRTAELTRAAAASTTSEAASARL